MWAPNFQMFLEITSKNYIYVYVIKVTFILES